MATTIHVDVVSAEESIFSGDAKFVALPGENGELGILPRHTPLITRIKPGAVRIERADNGEEEFVFVAGGILEVQPGTVTVLVVVTVTRGALDDAVHAAVSTRHAPAAASHAAYRNVLVRQGDRRGCRGRPRPSGPERGRGAPS